MKLKLKKIEVQHEIKKQYYTTSYFYIRNKSTDIRLNETTLFVFVGRSEHAPAEARHLLHLGVV